jgi:cell division protein FtsB
MAARSPNRATKTAGTRAPASRRTSTRGSSAAANKAAPARSRPKARTAGSNSKSRSRIPGNVLIWGVCGALALAAWWIYPVMRMHYVEQRNLSTLQAQYASVKSRNEALRKQVQRLKTPAGIEEAARESLGLVRQGESAYVVIPENGRKPATSTAAASLTALPSEAEGPSDPVTILLDGVFGFAP